MKVNNQFLFPVKKQKWNGETWQNEIRLNTARILRGTEWLSYRDRRKKSRFQSSEKGTMIIQMEEDENDENRSIKFKEIKILFY